MQRSRHGIGGGLRNPLVVGTPLIGLTQDKDDQHPSDQQHVFNRVALLLTAIRARLLARILGAPDTPFSAVMPKRGEAGACPDAGAGASDGVRGPCIGATMALASASVTLRCFASSVTDRLGTSPSTRSMACSTAKRT